MAEEFAEGASLPSAPRRSAFSSVKPGSLIMIKDDLTTVFISGSRRVRWMCRVQPDCPVDG
jgi:hypothetical protein